MFDGASGVEILSDRNWLIGSRNSLLQELAYREGELPPTGWSSLSPIYSLDLLKYSILTDIRQR